VIGVTERLDLAASLRALRRRADLSQRELAERSGIPPSTVGSVESGRSKDPRFRTIERLVAATGARLAILDLDGTPPVPLDTEEWRDRGGRHLPAHLDPFRVTWEGTGPVDRFGYLRNRLIRDLDRRDRAGKQLSDLNYEIRRLGPRDVTTLAAIRADPGLALGDAPPAGGPDPTTEAGQDRARLYLRDPSLCHWIAEEYGTGRVLAHLAVRLHPRYPGRPAMVVLEFGARPEYRDGFASILLIAAMCDEAERCGVGEIVAAPGGRAAARYLRRLGFRRGPRQRLLTFPE